jgi:hypothetical protein
MMCCWLCLPKPWFCFFFPRPFRLSLSWSLSLSTPYLIPCLFFFVPVLWEETRKTVSILVRPLSPFSAVRGFLFVSPSQPLGSAPPLFFVAFRSLAFIAREQFRFIHWLQV